MSSVAKSIATEKTTQQMACPRIRRLANGRRPQPEGSMKNMLVSGMGLATSIIQGLMKHAPAKGLTPDDIHWLASQQDAEVTPVLEEMTSTMVDVLVKARARIGRVFRVRRGGKRTTEQVIGATAHTYVNEKINSQNFPLTEGPEEERELVAFQVTGYDHDPSSEEILKEFKTRGLERPTHEDALKFDEAHPDEKGVFVFLHEPWLDFDRGPRALVVRRVEVGRELGLFWFDAPWVRNFWFVGVRPRK